MFYLILPPLDPDLDSNCKLGLWIRIHVDIFRILDPDPHENFCGSETLKFLKSKFAQAPLFLFLSNLLSFLQLKKTPHDFFSSNSNIRSGNKSHMQILFKYNRG